MPVSLTPTLSRERGERSEGDGAGTRTDGTTSHSTKPRKSAGQVAGHRYASFTFNILLWTLFALGTGAAEASPTITLGAANNYCSVFCYIRVPFTITHYESTQRIGRIFCDFDAEVTSRLPVYNGEPRTKIMQASPIGVFAITPGEIKGFAEMETGIRKVYFVDGKIKSIHCHL